MRITKLMAAVVAGLALSAGSASAAVILPGPTIVGNGNGTANAIVITTVPNNDNVVAGNPNLLTNGKNFSSVGPIDIVYSASNSTATTEYAVSEGIANNTGVHWTSYIVQLGFGSGPGFVPSTAGDGLDFDFPTFDPAPAVGPGTFAGVVFTEDQLQFIGPPGVAPGGALAANFSVDVPDGLPGGTFTLRQFPVPEPATMGLFAAAAIGSLGGRRRRRA